jgi:urate oxidase
MPAKLRSNRYGKSRVRLMRLTKHAAQSGHEAYHDLDEWTVQILLTGDFETAHALGDNSKILPTDTMKNTVYFVARESKAESMEAYAMELIDYILTRNSQVASAEVSIESTLWKRLHIDGQPFPTAFMRGSDERQTTTVSRQQRTPFTITSGLDHLTILKTANSGFTGYIKDALTTLPETTDRLFGTALKAEWPYTPEAIARAAASPDQAIDFNKVRSHIREAMISTFAKHDSLSVQQTLFAMAEAALHHTTLIDEIYLLMPNKHNLLVDLSRFGQKNPNHIFVPTDEPHGTIEATVRRG